MNTIQYSKQVALVAVALLSVGTLGVGAHAGEQVTDANRRTVHYSDLNLNTSAGAQVLYRRIRGAAEQVCGVVDAKQLERAAAARACVDEAIVSSVRSVNNAQLTSIASAQGVMVQTSITVASAR